jgi:hypothetical protein
MANIPQLRAVLRHDAKRLKIHVLSYLWYSLGTQFIMSNIPRLSASHHSGLEPPSMNWMVQALNADWLTAVVYQTVYHGYDKTFLVTALITLVTSL